MMWYAFFLVALQSLYCSAVPRYGPELRSMADRALGVALTETNKIHAVNNLYRVTQTSITKAIPLGLNTYDLILSFGVKETTCPRSSAEDPQNCPFKAGFFVSSQSCSSRVRVTAETTQLLTLRCNVDDSSESSESASSEEMMGRRIQPSGHQFMNSGPALTVPGAGTGPASAATGPREQRQPRGQPRGDTFSNHLE